MSYLKEYGEQVEKFIGVCRKLSTNLYVTSHGGNMAWRLEENLLLITPTRLNKGAIRPEDCVFIDLSGATVEGKRDPTGETPMYLNFFRNRTDIVSVIHCHPPYTGAFSITKGKNWLMRPVFPETCTEVGPVPVVPYAEPLTQRLADNFLPYLEKYNAFLMESHGLVVMSPKDIEWTLMLTELLEMHSLSLLQALSIGDVKEMSREDVRDLDNTMKTRGLPLFGVPGGNGSLVDLYFPE
jgi:L-fuculose-phosphate aldolase